MNEAEQAYATAGIILAHLSKCVGSGDVTLRCVPGGTAFSWAVEVKRKRYAVELIVPLEQMPFLLDTAEDFAQQTARSWRLQLDELASS